MLDLLDKDYRSTKPYQKLIKDNRFVHPRSFFSFLSRTIIESKFKSIWCGTHMKIRNMELMHSAAGSKPDDIQIFTDFNYLEPKHILDLLPMWLNVDLSKYLFLFHEISQMLQGRPRFFSSFLHKLIESNDINDCFRSYLRDMTTNHDSALFDSSLYYFWEQRIQLTIQPIANTDTQALQTRLVSDILVELCISYLFGDGSSRVYLPECDLVSTCLVMVSKNHHRWDAKMAEPLVLSAGLNFLADKAPDVLMDYFAHKLFSPLSAPNLSPQERGHVMEFVIALRFIQCWWSDPNLRVYLPSWAVAMNIEKPLGVIDSRFKGKESAPNNFIQQILNPSFPWILFPSANAGPDLRYSIFCCYIKTTSTANSQSTMFVSPNECKKNIETMDPKNWYRSQKNVQKECEIEGKRFVHMRFELPDTAPSMKDTFSNGQTENDFIICVNLESDFAHHFFGQSFVSKYRNFVSRSLNKESAPFRI
jgi:hypothetical protein